jgi:sec-independent protein translocase protein TatA
MLSHFALIGDLDTPALLIILAIVLLLFGGKKLPELSRNIGSSMRELRKGLYDSGNNNKQQKETAASENKQETTA